MKSVFTFLVWLVLGALANAQGLPFPGPGAKSSGVTFSDDFNRADSATLGASWAHATGFGDIKIVANTARATTDSAYSIDLYQTATNTNNQFVQWTVTFSGSGGYLDGYLRADSSLANAYFCLISNGGSPTTAIYKTVTTTTTQLTSNATTWTTGDVAKCTVSGTTITLFKNGSSVATATDSAVASGSIGLAIFAIGNPNEAYLDDFSGGDL